MSMTWKQKTESMSKNSKRFRVFLQVVMMVVASITLFNIAHMFWYPVRIPLSLGPVLRVFFAGVVEQQYYLIPLSVLICILLFVSGIFVRKGKIVIPMLALTYMTYDVTVVLVLMITSAIESGYNYWRNYLVDLTVSLGVFVLLLIYCVKRIKARCQNPKAQEKVDPTPLPCDNAVRR